MFPNVTVNIPGQPSITANLERIPAVRESISVTPTMSGGPAVTYAVQRVTTIVASDPGGWNQTGIVIDVA